VQERVRTASEELAAAGVRVDSEIRQGEDRFGLNTQGLLRLGVQMGQAQDSLEAANRRLRVSSSDETNEPDPRIIDIAPADTG